MIEAMNVVKRYGTAVALDDISFHVGNGRIVGFVGPNGAGKTTMMQILASFIPPTSGSATVAGFDVAAESLAVRRSIGYLPENVPFYGEMRLREYLVYRAKLKDVPPRRRRRRVDEVMAECWIDDVASKPIGRLSKGYRQRVGLADCMVHDPKILILDEPTAGLDPHQIRQTRKLIRALAEKHTVLLSTHILSEVEMVCDDVIMINHGRIVISDSLANLLGGPGARKLSLTISGDGEAVKQALAGVSALSKVQWRRQGVENEFFLTTRADTDARAAVSRAVASAGATVLALAHEQRTLEDVFVEIITAQAPGATHRELRGSP